MSGIDLRFTMQNSIYGQFQGWFTSQSNADHNAVKVDFIWPCTDKHIKKYSGETRIVVTETKEQYERIHLPYFQDNPPDRLQWVYNILEKKAEADRLLLEDTDEELGFMLHPDLKWTMNSTDDLYCLVLLHRRDIRCMRDLQPKHIPVLQNVVHQCREYLSKEHGVPASDLLFYVHYPPSYYHFHIHVVNCNYSTSSCTVGRAHLVSDIIANLERYPDFYAEQTLTLRMNPEHPVARVLLEEA